MSSSQNNRLAPPPIFGQVSAVDNFRKLKVFFCTNSSGYEMSDNEQKVNGNTSFTQSESDRMAERTTKDLWS